MKRSDISDREALEACWAWGASDDRGGAVQVLQAAGWPFKVVVRKLEHLDDRGLIDYGVSLNYPWRTPEGEVELVRLALLSSEHTT